MAAPQRRTREMLSAADGKRLASRKPEAIPARSSPLSTPRAGRPPVVAQKHTTAGGYFADALAALRIDLEMHRRQACEVETLIAKLSVYANGAVPAPGKRRGGRPPLDQNDAFRARKAADMRKRRAKIKAAAPSPQKAKPKQRRAPSAPSSTPSEQSKAPPAPSAAAVKEIVLVTPADENSAVPVLSPAGDKVTAAPDLLAARKLRKAELRRKRRQAASGLAPPSLGAGFDGYRQPPSSLTEWQIDEKTGVSSRQRITEGETPRLRSTPLPGT